VTPYLTGNDPKSLRTLIEQSILETAKQGNVVIVSHAASFALAGSEDVLRVLVTASPETRARRAVEEGGVDQKQATKAVAESDGQRAAYLKRFYGVDQELPTHYDLSLNSDLMPVEVMSELVVRAALDW
jgi:cytidylate kinase